jgi:hypothetical protein
MHLYYWSLYQTKPYFDDREGIRNYKLSVAGYKGFCVCNYSKYEHEQFKKFKKDTDTYLIEYYKSGDEYHREIGHYECKSFSIWTKNPEEFLELLKIIPARNKIEIVPKITKVQYKNHLFLKGEKAIALSYSDETFSIFDYLNYLKVIEKLTK